MQPSTFRLAFLFLLAPLLLCVAAAPPQALQPRAPQPTKRMGQRRALKPSVQKKDYSSFLCPGGSVACPVPLTLTVDDIDDLGRSKKEAAESLEGSLTSLADWFRVGFECIELDIEPNSCGGCLALGAGHDCSMIPFSKTTGCEGGNCLVYTCTEGYVVGPDRASCVKRGTVAAAVPVTAQGQGGVGQVPLK